MKKARKTQLSVDQKGQKLSRLAEAVLRLVAQVGTEGLTLSRLARAAGVSRAWIYKYGGTHEELVAFATDHFGKVFTSLEATQAGDEITQLSALCKISETQAQLVSEVVGSLRMGLAHAWAYGELKDLAALDEVKVHFHHASLGVLRGLRQ